MVSFIHAVRNGISNFANVNGRMSRSAFWWFALFCALVASLVIFLIVSTVGVDATNARIINLIADITFWYVFIVPGIRRLHDIDKPGTNALWILLPFIGWFYLVYLFCQPSDREENYYGEPMM